jgi:hypothetical protein
MKLFLQAIVAIMIVVTPHIVRADMNFFDRIMFSDKAYAKEIEVKAYIITQEQACAALCDPSQEVIQLSKKELGGSKTYLYLKVKNTGNKHTCGTLACRVPSYSISIKTTVVAIASSKNFNFYLTRVRQM